jgi:CRP-like cAMP-binding protein
VEFRRGLPNGCPASRQTAELLRRIRFSEYFSAGAPLHQLRRSERPFSTPHLLLFRPSPGIMYVNEQSCGFRRGLFRLSAKRWMPMKEKTEILKQIQIFKTLDDEELELVAGLLEERVFEHDATIVKMHEPGSDMFIIKSGGVNIIYLRDGEGEYMLRHFGAGKHFGEMSLFDEKTRSALVKAISDTRILVVRKDSFIEFINEHKSTGIKILIAIIQELSTRLRLTSSELSISMGLEERPLSQEEIDKLTDELAHLY